MKKYIVSFLFLLALVFGVSAQNNKAMKIDEFGNAEGEYISATLDAFALQLQNNPNSKGYVIVYDGRYYSYNRSKNPPTKIYRLPPLGETIERNYSMMLYLTYNRGIAKEKLLFINGGFREDYTVELWIVPAGARMPPITPTLDNMKYGKGKPRGIDFL